MVERILVSGTDDGFAVFQLTVCMSCNRIERRGQTVLYTVFDEDLNGVLRLAKASSLTVQRWDGGRSEWVKVVDGEHPGWPGTDAAKGESNG